MATRKGRPPKPVANAANAIGELAECLREARLGKALSRQDLATKLGCSITTVQRAEGGGAPPPWSTVRDYVGIVDLDPGETEALWKKAVAFRRKITRPSFTQSPGIDLVRTPDELGAALARAWEDSGRPSTREMEQRADRHYQETRSYASLSRSSAERFSRRKSLPGSERTLQAYLVALRIPERRFPMWVQAWRRVQHHRLSQRMADREQVKLTHRMEAPFAKARMQEAGLIPREKFPGAVAPWSAVHTSCAQVSRYRLRSVLQGLAHCPVCGDWLSAGTGEGENH
ncbi:MULTISPECIES: helix-turn-helix domain-containing protein [Streptomyces]|uniref:helix-turn-helix domain-containing protein n=1 Tax=Streptomyces TaxID=1883 RepID=UPI0013013F93|nr:helix-turn-helix transcriptional regulator [Streptomyces sp. CB00072]